MINLDLVDISDPNCLVEVQWEESDEEQWTQYWDQLQEGETQINQHGIQFKIQESPEQENPEEEQCRFVGENKFYKQQKKNGKENMKSNNVRMQKQKHTNQNSGIIKNVQGFFQDLRKMSNSGRPSKPRLEQKEQDVQLLKKQYLGISNAQGTISEHHVLPGNLINQMLQTCCQQKNRQNTLKAIQKFLNQNQKLKEIVKNDLGNQSETVHTIIYWKQSNLFPGPEEQYRQLKAKHNVDFELLELQSKNYRDQFGKVMELIKARDPSALELFLRMKTPHQVALWKQDQKTGLFKAVKLIGRINQLF